jgi:hypothetical protein
LKTGVRNNCAKLDWVTSYFAVHLRMVRMLALAAWIMRAVMRLLSRLRVVRKRNYFGQILPIERALIYNI